VRVGPTLTLVKIKTVYPTTSTGGGSATLKPAKTTTYQWRFAGDGNIQSTRSPTKTVRVTP
jgi:hypothetical protein